jgi:hypothetical protein
MAYGKVVQEVQEELLRATAEFGAFASTHEGYAVILEELDELWAEIKDKKSTNKKMRKEAIQVAAMAIRFVVDCCEGV